MANAQTYEDQAKHNYKVLKHLQTKSECRDWQITVAFYTALHIIDCNFAKANPDWRKMWASAGMETGWHAARLKCINSVYSDIYNSYRFLNEKSKLVRYLETIDKKAVDVISEQEAKEFVNKHLGAILKKFKYSW